MASPKRLYRPFENRLLFTAPAAGRSAEPAVDAHNLALDTSDPQQSLLARVTEGEPALVIVRHQVVCSGHPTAQDNISGRKKP
jgi:hypothetical protein